VVAGSLELATKTGNLRPRASRTERKGLNVTQPETAGNPQRGPMEDLPPPLRNLRPQRLPGSWVSHSAYDRRVMACAERGRYV